MRPGIRRALAVALAVITVTSMISASVVLNGPESNVPDLSPVDSAQAENTSTSSKCQLGAFELTGYTCYSDESFDTSSQSSGPDGIQFNSDGTKMYIAGFSNDKIYEYDLSTAYDPTSASYSQSLDVSSRITNPASIEFNGDGTVMHVLENQDNEVHQYNLSTAYDISTASHDSATGISGNTDGDPHAIRWNDDGSRLFILMESNNDIHEYSASTNYDSSTISNQDSLAINNFDATAGGIEWSDNGKKLFVTGRDDDWVGEYHFSTPYDLSSLSDSKPNVNHNSKIDISAQMGSPAGLVWNDKGDQLYVVDYSNAEIEKYDVSVKYNISSHEYSKGISGQTGGDPFGLDWGNDGSKMYMLDSANNNLHSYSASSAYNLSSTSTKNTLDISGEDSTSTGIAWNNDGTKLYLVGTATDAVYEYSVSTAWDITTATNQSKFDVSGKETNPQAIAWGDSGNKLYVTGASSDKIHEYDASTSYDITTLSHSQSKDIGKQDTSPEGLYWNDDGSKVYVAGDDNDSVFEYDVSTSWDVSTASLASELDVYMKDEYNGNAGAITTALAWAHNGSRFYTLSSNRNSVHEFNPEGSVASSSSANTVSVKVKNQNGESIENANVTVNSTSDWNVTDANGKASFSLSDGDYTLTAQGVDCRADASETVTVNGSDEDATITMPLLDECKEHDSDSDGGDDLNETAGEYKQKFELQIESFGPLKLVGEETVLPSSAEGYTLEAEYQVGLAGNRGYAFWVGPDAPSISLETEDTGEFDSEDQTELVLRDGEVYALTAESDRGFYSRWTGFDAAEDKKDDIVVLRQDNISEVVNCDNAIGRIPRCEEPETVTPDSSVTAPGTVTLPTPETVTVGGGVTVTPFDNGTYQTVDGGGDVATIDPGTFETWTLPEPSTRTFADRTPLPTRTYPEQTTPAAFLDTEIIESPISDCNAIQITYYDPAGETTQIDYDFTALGNRYNSSITFDEPISYYQDTIDENVSEDGECQLTDDPVDLPGDGGIDDIVGDGGSPAVELNVTKGGDRFSGSVPLGEGGDQFEFETGGEKYEEASDVGGVGGPPIGGTGGGGNPLGNPVVAVPATAAILYFFRSDASRILGSVAERANALVDDLL